MRITNNCMRNINKFNAQKGINNLLQVYKFLMNKGSQACSTYQV